MTICIAAMCNVDNKSGTYSPAIVFCADRLLTSSISFEHGNSKIKLISGRCIIMEAGDGTISDLILNEEVINDQNSELSVKGIAEIINQKTIEVITQKVNESLLINFGISLDRLYDDKKISQDLLNLVLRKVTEVRRERNVEFIVAGLDKNSLPSLYKVSSISGLECYNSIGFISIGIGADLSLLELTKFSHNNLAGYMEVISKVYRAKIESEKVGSIGKNTDLGMLYLKTADVNDQNWVAGDILFGDNIKEILNSNIEKIKDFEAKIREEIKPKLKGAIFTDPEAKTEEIKPSSQEQSSHSKP